MKENKYSKIKIVLTIIVLMVTAGAFLYAMMEPDVIIASDSIRITGMYGTTISINEIESVQMRQSLPEVIRRTNGIDFFSIKKGHYRLAEFDKGRLFIHDKTVPCVLIKLSNGNVVIIALEDRAENEEIFQILKGLIE